MALAAVFHTVHITMLTHLFWDHKGQQCKCCLKPSGTLYNNIAHCKNEKILFLGFSDWHTGGTSRHWKASQIFYCAVHSKNVGILKRLQTCLSLMICGNWMICLTVSRVLAGTYQFYFVHSSYPFSIKMVVFFLFTHMTLVNNIFLLPFYFRQMVYKSLHELLLMQRPAVIKYNEEKS